MIEASEALERIEQALRRSGLGEAEVYYHGAKRGLSRFANTELCQNTLLDETNAVVRVVEGGAAGNASTSDLGVDGLVLALEQARAIAVASPRNPDFPGLAGPGGPALATTSRAAAATAAMTPEGRARLLEAPFARVRKLGLRAAGVLETTVGQFAFGSTTGLRHRFTTTAASLRFFALDETGRIAGFAGGLHRDIGAIDVADVSETAIKKCLDGRDPMDVPAGEYDVVLEPYAVTELLEWLAMTSFGAREVAQGTSVLSGREGTRIMGENVTLYDDANEPGDLGHGVPFDREGTVKRRVDVVDKGIARGPVWDRSWAKRAGQSSTGHASPDPSEDAPTPPNVYMAAGSDAVSDLCARVERGLYVTRFHYVNGLLDPRSALMTGMTRDGAFWIEDGKIRRGVKNIRFTESILRAFGRIEGVSRDRIAVPTWWTEVGAYCSPYLLIRKFRFTGDRAP